MYKKHDNLLSLNFVKLLSKNYCIHNCNYIHNYNIGQKDSFHVLTELKCVNLVLRFVVPICGTAYQQ